MNTLPFKLIVSLPHTGFPAAKKQPGQYRLPDAINHMKL